VKLKPGVNATNIAEQLGYTFVKSKQHKKSKTKQWVDWFIFSLPCPYELPHYDDCGMEDPKTLVHPNIITYEQMEKETEHDD
jgi:hypothetical protein